ncbi:MAG: helix-turn-helix transcriptional regulator [candidate division WOR-3 bacterium]|nr:helix-turn-helix transcriptional regulator [candidate division WOR-3 bacterium]
MTGLEALGARLKQIRQQAGLSQMKLAKLIGFEPAHGYKYILRLEKGQVPNPTLRTIAACIEACGVGWQAVVDVLPATGTVTPPAPAQPSTANRKSEIPVPASPAPQSLTPSPSPPAPPRRKDSRPMREQLRSRRIEQRELRTRRFWSGMKQADEATGALLHALRVPSPMHRAYLSFARACCSTIDAFEAARPEIVERELAKLVQPATVQGLDRRVLAQIESACTRVFRSQPTA